MAAYGAVPDVLPASPVDATQEPKPASKAKAVVAMVASAAVFATLATFAMKPNAVSTTATDLAAASSPPPAGVNTRGSDTADTTTDTGASSTITDGVGGKKGDDDQFTVTGVQTTSDSLLVDPDADSVTLALYQSLQDMSLESGILFGHQMTNWNSQSWTHPKDDGKYDASDVHTSTGDWPAVFGYNFLDMIDGESFEEHAKWGFQNGAIVNFYWEAKNPSNSADSYNGNNNPISEITEGGAYNDVWTGWLDNIADFANNLKVDDQLVPIVFRLFHENSGFWFWWGTKYATGEEFKAAWIYTVEYLRDTKGVHNLIYAYAPAKPTLFYNESFVDMYPGDEYVDIISWDRYDLDTTYQQTILDDCDVVVPFAVEHGKVVALGETGVAGGVQDTTDPEWFFEQQYKPMLMSDTCKYLSYALTYTNYKSSEYWVPLPGQATYPGFLDMYKSKYSMFLGDGRWQSTDYYQIANGTYAGGNGQEMGHGHSQKAKYFPASDVGLHDDQYN